MIKKGGREMGKKKSGELSVREKREEEIRENIETMKFNREKNRRRNKGRGGKHRNRRRRNGEEKTNMEIV